MNIQSGGKKKNSRMGKALWETEGEEGSWRALEKDDRHIKSL